MSTDLCGCGTFAIGRCAACHAFVCGDHSALVEGRRLCASDIAARREAAERDRRRQRLEAEAEAAARRRVAALEEAEAERFIALAVDALRRAGSPGAVSVRDWLDTGLGASVIRRTLPRLLGRGWVVGTYEHATPPGNGDYGDQRGSVTECAVVLTADEEWLLVPRGIRQPAVRGFWYGVSPASWQPGGRRVDMQGLRARRGEFVEALRALLEEHGIGADIQR